MADQPGVLAQPEAQILMVVTTKTLWERMADQPGVLAQPEAQILMEATIKAHLDHKEDSLAQMEVD
jgi:hypothetical protein